MCMSMAYSNKEYLHMVLVQEGAQISWTPHRRRPVYVCFTICFISSFQPDMYWTCCFTTCLTSSFHPASASDICRTLCFTARLAFTWVHRIDLYSLKYVCKPFFTYSVFGAPGYGVGHLFWWYTCRSSKEQAPNRVCRRSFLLYYSDNTQPCG